MQTDALFRDSLVFVRSLIKASRGQSRRGEQMFCRSAWMQERDHPRGSGEQTLRPAASHFFDAYSRHGRFTYGANNLW
ncbi:hypothetical protein ACFWG5_18305 [Streptomyces hydrogenans]|uniref:hypothetical protein n=1 Tax=Streptomyces hydrogenans TaxID=1873719 RepID=UPI003653A108